MTWVVGRSLPFGYAVGLSDIRVTFDDKSELDCLQKIYAVAPNIAVGFAGSVKVGFAMVDRLRQFLRLPGPGFGWDPAFVADNFPALAREQFGAAESRERDVRCQLLLLSVHPNRNSGDGPFAITVVHRLESPTFDAEAAGPTEVVSIGKGQDQPTYIAALNALNAAPHKIHALQSLNAAGSALALTLSIETAIRDTPTPGISPHLHVCIVRREGIVIAPNNQTIYTTPVERFRMPPVATSFAELTQIVSRRGSTPTGAVC